jgi:type IV secretory pathway TraG/TraD family ATPase VirD4
MMEVSDDPFVRMKLSRYAVRLADHDIKSLFEVVEAARTEVEFITEPAVADCLRRDELDPDEILHGSASIFVIQPQEVVSALTRFRRIFATCFLGRFMREDGASATPTLLLIDELFSIGFLEELDTAFTAVRKLNLTLYVSVPSVGLLQQLYPQSYKAILDNCGLKQWCDVNLEDSELVSTLCGEREIVRRTKTVNWSPAYDYYDKPSADTLTHLHVSNNNTTERLPLIRPHELRNTLGPDGLVMFMADVPKPILAEKRGYFKIPFLRRLARPNPFIARKPVGKVVPAVKNTNWKSLLTR